MKGIMTALGVANTLLAALNHPLIEEAFSTFDYGDSPEKLKGGITTVKSLLLDAANNDDLSETVRDYINKLKDVVYDADDLFDELITRELIARAERKKLFDNDDVYAKVRLSQKVKKLSLKLNDIADEHGRFSTAMPHRMVKRTETSLNGRQNDANKVIGMLLDSRKCVYYLAIVGIEGVGKTTLAKLVFDDKRVKDEFPVRLWVCVSDQDGGARLDVKQILLKILESLKLEFYDSLTVEYLQLEYKRNLEGKKFLLVLDDIRSENIIELRNLKELLMIQGSVSRIIATTQSKETARMIGNYTHQLEGLPEEHLRRLSFEKPPHHRRLRVETFSNVYVPDVVGRDGDTNKVIGMLLDSKKCVYFLAIVGIGGMGKTTLAKLVFGDKRIRDEFPIRLWVCVSDQDGTLLDEKKILASILKSLNCWFDDSSSIDTLQSIYQFNLKGKEFLLVLDDIWSEKIIELDNLKNLLKIDGSKGRIIATTRSKETARIIGNGVHELEGLSDEHSRRLFEMAAFGEGEKPAELVEIGENIVKKSSNVPLAIMVIGSLLYGQPIDKWHKFLENGFNRFSKGMDEVMSILKISYDNLDPSLKSCFAYCALFPKDYVISKATIINLWNAQGYIVPFDEGQSIENAGEEHFSVLLQRCFFQDVEKNEDGEIVSFKIHDLMHDLAQRVSGKEICTINSSKPNLECGVRHILLNLEINSSKPNLECDDDIKLKSKIRSYLMFRDNEEVELGDKLPTTEMSKDWICLRALALGSKNVRLPDTIGNWLHLRYLNLAYSNMKKLPGSIVKLYNLQTLDISYCRFLEELPKEFRKLVNLTHLYTQSCLKLSYMPVGMSNLSRLRTLTEFVVEDESTSGMQRVAQLIDLKALMVNLKGIISIRFREQFNGAKGYDWEGSCFEHAEHLSEVMIDFPLRIELLHTQIAMEKLKPHPNLRKFRLSCYKGKKIATWGRAQDNWATFFPNLVYISLDGCFRLQELPMLSKLRHLKSLSLVHLVDLEYIEEEVTSSSGSGSFDDTFFPSLEFLHIYNLLNLKGWRRPGNESESHCQPAFSILSNLSIRLCIRLESFPSCLSCPEISLADCNNVVITTADGVHTSTSQISKTQDTECEIVQASKK